jgi:hypothetical protein
VSKSKIEKMYIFQHIPGMIKKRLLKIFIFLLKNNVFLIMQSFAKGALVGTILFATYITLSPGVAGITFREDSEGRMRFCPGNLFRLMVHPLHRGDLWTLSTLDTNWPFVAAVSGFVFFAVE